MKHSYFSKLSGVSFCQDSLSKVRPHKTKLRVIAVDDNEYDEYACDVQALLSDGWEHIGWIQKGKNKDIHDAIKSGYTVEIVCTEITGLDKDTLGCNVAIEYGNDDSGEIEKLPRVPVVYGDADYIYFDEVNHKAYDMQCRELYSGSNIEKDAAGEPNLEYAAKAIAKKTGCLKEDVIEAWGYKAELASSYGTLLHRALEITYNNFTTFYQIDLNSEREPTMSNWMPEAIGKIVDEFRKASGITALETEVRVKYGLITGIIDGLEWLDDTHFRIHDYKIVAKMKTVNYKEYGKHTKYTVQQNTYRMVMEMLGYKCDGMFLWQYDGTEWKKHQVDKIELDDEIIKKLETK